MGHAYAAVDLGATGGRVILARLDGDRLALREVHRFANRALRVEGTLRWDVPRLYGELLAGLGAAARAAPDLASVAIDGWGWDFGLLDARGRLLGAPYQWRDRRTDGIPARLHARVAEDEFWAATGVQSHPGSTLHQLYSMVMRRSSSLARAARLLLVPELLVHWLCGAQVAEHTLASTTQCYDPEARAWVVPLLARARIPTHVFAPVVLPGTGLGEILPAAARRAGVSGVRVVASAAHAAASATAVVMRDGAGAAYVLTGDASRVGARVATAVKSDAARRLGFTNSGGVDGAVCLERTTAGLRILQECRRALERAGAPLDEAAGGALAKVAAARPRAAVVDLDDPSLAAPDDMPTAIRECCARAGQPIPATGAELVRTILESLAWGYRRSLGALEQVLGRRLEVVHLVGAGARYPLLCQLTADACGRPVLAGPAEATALGNALAQAIAAGRCASWSDARALVHASFPPVAYEPTNAAAWDEESARVERLFDEAWQGDGPPP